MHSETEICYYHLLASLIPEIIISLSILSSVTTFDTILIIHVVSLFATFFIYLYNSIKSLSTHACVVFLSLITDPTTSRT